MADRDTPDDLRALAVTLRAAIDSLDQRIEERARALAAERGLLAVGDIATEVPLLARRIADLMRRTMLKSMPDGRAYTDRITPEEWMSHAASMLATLYSGIAEEEEKKLEQQRDGMRKPV